MTKDRKQRQRHTTKIQYGVDFQHPVQIGLSMASCLMNKHKSSKLSAKDVGLRLQNDPLNLQNKDGPKNALNDVLTWTINIRAF